MKLYKVTIDNDSRPPIESSQNPKKMLIYLQGGGYCVPGSPLYDVTVSSLLLYDMNSKYHSFFRIVILDVPQKIHYAQVEIIMKL